MKNYKMLVLVFLFPSASLSQTEASLFTISHCLSYTYHSGSAIADWASLIAQLVTNLPAMQEILVRFLDWEDLLEKGEATHSSILGLPLWLNR